MKSVKYSYNTKTCRYEPARLSIWAMLGYTFLFAITTAVLSIGILFLHSKLFVSEKALALRDENNALKQHHAALVTKLNSIEGVLVGIKQTEAALHQKIFDTASETSTDETGQFGNKILLADASGFQGMLTLLKEKSAQIRRASDQNKLLFSNMIVSHSDLNFLTSIPSIAPVKTGELATLVSGFGIRINPFHKGNYNHPGADFAAVRGSDVLATGSGKVIKVVKNSSLQAGYGNYVEVSHSNNIITRYAHLEEVRVRPGQKIPKGFVIGTVGTTGGSTAPHIHYEIIRNGIAVNPVPYMMEGLSDKAYIDLQKAGNKKNQSLD